MDEKQQNKYIIDQDIYDCIVNLFATASVGKFENCIYYIGCLNTLIATNGIEELK